MKVRALDEWHEDDGPVLWWEFPVNEPPYVGTPLDLPRTVQLSVFVKLGENYQWLIPVGGGWPGYHTHWTPMPEIPTENS